MSVCLRVHDFILLYCHHFWKFNCLFNVWLKSRASLGCYLNLARAIGIQTRSIDPIACSCTGFILIHFNEIRTFSIFWWMPKILFSLNLEHSTNDILKAARDFFTIPSLIKFLRLNRLSNAINFQIKLNIFKNFRFEMISTFSNFKRKYFISQWKRFRKFFFEYIDSSCLWFSLEKPVWLSRAVFLI